MKKDKSKIREITPNFSWTILPYGCGNPSPTINFPVKDHWLKDIEEPNPIDYNPSKGITLEDLEKACEYIFSKESSSKKSVIRTGKLGAINWWVTFKKMAHQYVGEDFDIEKVRKDVESWDWKEGCYLLTENGPVYEG